MAQTEDRICKVTKEILGNEKKLDITLLLKGYNLLSKAERLIKRGMKLYDKEEFLKAQKPFKRGMRLYNEGRETVDEALIKILEQKRGD